MTEKDSTQDVLTLQLAETRPEEPSLVTILTGQGTFHQMVIAGFSRVRMDEEDQRVVVEAVFMANNESAKRLFR